MSKQALIYHSRAPQLGERAPHRFLTAVGLVADADSWQAKLIKEAV